MAPNISKELYTCATPEKVSGPRQRCDLSVSGDSLKKGSDESLFLTQRTNALLRGMDLTLKHHDAPGHIIEDLDKQVHSYLDTALSETVWLQRCKFLLTYPLAKYLKNDLPPSPDIIFAPSGNLKKWMKPRLNGFNARNTHLWYSWFQTKRCTIPLSENVVEESYAKHLKALTSVDPGDDDMITLIFKNSSFMNVLEQVRGMFTALVKFGDSFEELSAKTSASFEFTRKLGGQQNYVRKLAGLSTFNPDSEISLTSPELYSMEYHPWVYTKNGIRPNYSFSRYCAYGEEEWNSLPDLIKDLDTKKRLKCTIQAVLEPNKVRIISKGESLPYYACRPYQKALLKAIQEFSCFNLTGRPILDEDIRRLTKMSLPDDNWFSIDYSAATDGLSWKYSGKILEYIISLLTEKEQELLMQVLGPHDLYYPLTVKTSATEFRGTQTNGQLMGSIISFPILCLANLGVYLQTTQLDQDLWSDQDRLDHVLINGDDMVYSANRKLWARHVDIGKKVGLEMSVGKAYVHREYLNINSTSFHCPLHSSYSVKELSVREIGFLNCGLFFGCHKVQGNNEGGKTKLSPAHEKMKLATSHSKTNPELGIAVNINTLLKGSLPGKASSVLKELLVLQKETISEECKTLTRQGKVFHRNLFIPELLGGMGVKAPDGFRFRVTKEEVYVAHGYIKEVPGCDFTDQFPLPGFPFEKKLEEVVDVPWASKLGGEDKEKPRVPVNRIFLKKVKYHCIHGFHRFVPNKNCCLGPIPKVEFDREMLSPDSMIFDDKFMTKTKRVCPVFVPEDNGACLKNKLVSGLRSLGEGTMYLGDKNLSYQETGEKCPYPSLEIISSKDLLLDWVHDNVESLSKTLLDYYIGRWAKF